MKLNNTTTAAEATDQMEGHSYGIDEENMHLAYQAFTQYSDPISSIVREVTSNAVDAHDEARMIRDGEITREDYEDEETFDELYRRLQDWEEQMVEIEISERHPLDGERWIAFHDYGLGLSPQRIEKIYSRFFSSNKRDTNDLIGAFGLGSKSPLSYCDMFDVITRYNGIEYHWTVYEEAKAPRIDLLNRKETDEPNGTTVRVPIKSLSDHSKFQEACKKQLAYFENLYFKGGFSNTDELNDYTLYEGDSFVYRPGNTFDELHICLGRVYYPINFDVLDMERGYSYRSNNKHWCVPIALNFDVGELDVVWNREAIEYTDRTISAIQERVESLKEEYRDLFEERCQSISSMEEWIRTKNSLDGSTITTPTGDVDLPYSAHLIDDTRVPYPKYSKHLKHLPNPFRPFKWHRKIKDGYVQQKSKSYNVNETIHNPDRKAFITRSGLKSRKNRYISEELGHHTFHLLKFNANKVRTDEETIRRKIARSKFDSSMEEHRISDEEVQAYLDFQQEGINYVFSKIEDYDAIEISESFKEKLREERRKAREEKKQKRNRKNTFPAKKLKRGGSWRHEMKWSRAKLRWKNVLRNDTLIIYGFRADDDALQRAGKIVRDMRIAPNGSHRHLNTQKLRVLKIAKKRAEHFEKLDRAYHVDDFLKRENPIIQRLLRRVANKLVKAKKPDMGSIPKMDESAKVLKSEVKSWRTTNVSSRQIERFLDLSDADHQDVKRYLIENWADPALKRKVKALRGYQEKYPLLRFINGYKINKHDTLRRELNDYASSKGDINPALLYRYNQHKTDQINDE